MNLLTYVHLRNIYRSTGVGRVARELTEHLAARPEIHVEVLADPGDHARIVDKVGSPWTEFRYHFMQHETSRQQALWYLMDRPTAEDYWPETDIVYCTAESYVPVKKSKLVVTSHDMQLFEPEAHVMSRSLLQQRAKWWLLFRKLAKKVDFFHAISRFSAERMAHYFPEIGTRLRVVPNAVSTAFFGEPTFEGEKVLARLGIGQTPYLLVPGGLHYRKNAELILNTWPLIHEKCPWLKLLVISHNSQMYLARAEAMGASVVIGGFQEEAQLVALYTHARAVWFPSRYEGFGMPVLEAMACGSPVVTSCTTALPEIAGEAAAALVHPDRPAEHVDALVALLNDDAARMKFGALGRERARQFTWDRSARMLAEGFASLL